MSGGLRGAPDAPLSFLFLLLGQAAAAGWLLWLVIGGWLLVLFLVVMAR